MVVGVNTKGNIFGFSGTGISYVSDYYVESDYYWFSVLANTTKAIRNRSLKCVNFINIKF